MFNQYWILHWSFDRVVFFFTSDYISESTTKAKRFSCSIWNRNLCVIVLNRLSLYHQVPQMTRLPFCFCYLIKWTKITSGAYPLILYNSIKLREIKQQINWENQLIFPTGGICCIATTGVWLCCKPTLIETTSGGLACQTSGWRARARVWLYFPTSFEREWMGEYFRVFVSVSVCIYNTISLVRSSCFFLY